MAQFEIRNAVTGDFLVIVEAETESEALALAASTARYREVEVDKTELRVTRIG